MRILLIIVLFLAGCKEAKRSKETQKSEANDDIVEVFLTQKKYKYLNCKDSIPEFIYNKLDKIYGGAFKIGDVHDKNVNLSDASFDSNEFKLRLNYFLLGNEFALICYTKGGIGTYDIVEFIQHDNGNKYMRYESVKELDDTAKLRKFLLEYPVPDVDSTL